jgi:hypothetical protein
MSQQCYAEDKPCQKPFRAFSVFYMRWLAPLLLTLFHPKKSALWGALAEFRRVLKLPMRRNNLKLLRPTNAPYVLLDYRVGPSSGEVLGGRPLSNSVNDPKSLFEKMYSSAPCTIKALRPVTPSPGNGNGSGCGKSNGAENQIRSAGEVGSCSIVPGVSNPH